MKKTLIILCLVFVAGCGQPNINDIKIGMSLQEVQAIVELKKVGQNEKFVYYRGEFEGDFDSARENGSLIFNSIPYVLCFQIPDKTELKQRVQTPEMQGEIQVFLKENNIDKELKATVEECLIKSKMETETKLIEFSRGVTVKSRSKGYDDQHQRWMERQDQIHRQQQAEHKASFDRMQRGGLP